MNIICVFQIVKPEGSSKAPGAVKGRKVKDTKVVDSGLSIREGLFPEVVDSLDPIEMGVLGPECRVMAQGSCVDDTISHR